MIKVRVKIRVKMIPGLLLDGEDIKLSLETKTMRSEAVLS